MAFYWKFPKLKSLKPGDKLIADGGFTCIPPYAKRTVMKDKATLRPKWDSPLYVKCSEGKHFLDGQLNSKGEVVGLRKVVKP